MGHEREAWWAHKWDMGGKLGGQINGMGEKLGGHINGTWAGSLVGK